MTAPVLGILLLVLLLWDVFVTVFHAQGHAGPLTRWQNRGVWALVRALGLRRDGRPRDALLGFGAPVMIVLTFLGWMAILVGAFALVYLPWMPTFLVSPGDLRGAGVEALYYSGVTASTLGLGDVVADRSGLRILTVLQAFGGFALLSASITYLLAVYREVIVMRALAADIATWLDARQGPPTVGSTSDEARARWAERVAGSLGHVLQAHFQYPVLHYFRPAGHQWALPMQLGPLLDLPEAKEWECVPGSGAGEGGGTSILLLRGSVERYLRVVEDVFVPRRFRLQAPAGEADAEQRRVWLAHRGLLDYMAYPDTGEPEDRQGW